MDFRKLSRAIQSHSTPNNTQTLNFTELSPNILEALVPGYSIISQYALAVLGFDISIFVTIGLTLFAVSKGGSYLWARLLSLFRYFFMSSVHIDDTDDLFDMVMGWLDARGSSKHYRNVRAKTPRGSQWEDANDSASNAALGDNGLFDYNKWSAGTPPRYEPYYGRHLIWHDGRLFIFDRSQKKNNQGALRLVWSETTREDVLQIDCVGRNPQPTKDLLRSIKSWSLEKKRHTTSIRHPTPKEQGRYRGAWVKTFTRPSRPMDTVILDAEQKSNIIKDMNEYLHPSSPKWYAMRGIPYRRGYLFHGPPGTGKTSLSFALAGIFGLEIYAISLQEPTLTESDLMQLFNSLPKRCIVLLEDVDAAGLLRDGKSDKKRGAGKKKGKEEEEKAKKTQDGKKGGDKDSKAKKAEEDNYSLKDLAKELKSLGSNKSKNDSGNNAQGHPNRLPGAGISLSGLLNAIDGVATHEGRVLVMTTNHPEKLDSALVRPGRIDLKIEFNLAMNQQIRELFVRMYAVNDQIPDQSAKVLNGDATHKKPKQENGSANKHEKNTANGHLRQNGRIDGAQDHGTLTPEDLDELAAEFAEHIPDATYSPAEIQNHLMRHKKSPRHAVDSVESWMKEIEEEKEKKRRKAEEDDSDNDDDDDQK